ncbi:MAG: peptide-binding protein [Candidatus Omnitrophica bacterium]|nr:peptide-binding protein [Candidatus Omnitrophota bacterium]
MRGIARSAAFLATFLFVCQVVPLRAENQPAAGLPAAPAAQAGDTLVAGSIGDARNLIPILASDSASADICGLVFNGLVKYAPDLTLVGDLAERWEVQEGGLVIVFHLRPGVRWHDEVPFTAQDVRFTYERLVDPGTPTPYSGDFERIERLEVMDELTVRVRYKEPFAPGLASWGMWMMPRHLLEGADWQTTPFARRPIGTGPFRFRRWKTGESIELIANPSYFEHRPHVDRHFTRIIPDQATMFLELSTEQVDLSGLTPLQFRRQIDTPFFRTHYRVFRYPAFGYTYVGYNLRDPRFADRRVRQALNLAINKEEIIDGVLLGLGRVSTGPFPPESWAYDEAVTPAPYDPAQAKDLLAEAGWRDSDGDGWLDLEGQPFRFTLLTNQGNDQRQKAAEIIQRRLKEIGIQVEIRVVEWSAFLSQFIDARNFEAILLGWGLSRDPDLFDIFHSSKTKPGEFNFVGYNNEDVDRLILEGRRTFDQAERAAIYKRIHALIYEDQPYTFLYVPDALPIVHARFRNVAVTPIGIGYNLIDWYAPTAEWRYPRWRLEP